MTIQPSRIRVLQAAEPRPDGATSFTGCSNPSAPPTTRRWSTRWTRRTRAACPCSSASASPTATRRPTRATTPSCSKAWRRSRRRSPGAASPSRSGAARRTRSRSPCPARRRSSYATAATSSPRRLGGRVSRRQADRRVVEVEGDVVVPVETASTKHEFAARTLRPKLMRLWDEYIVPLSERPARRRAEGLRAPSDVDLSDVPGALRSLAIDHAVAPVRRFKGGTEEARARLEQYLGAALRGLRQEPRPARGRRRLAHEPLPPLTARSRPSRSHSPCAPPGPGTRRTRPAYLEELIVRRELAMNHVYYEARYDTYEAVPDWARRTLAEPAPATPAPTSTAARSWKRAKRTTGTGTRP